MYKKEEIDLFKNQSLLFLYDDLTIIQNIPQKTCGFHIV